MNELLTTIVLNLPNLVGLVLFGLAMWYQNNRLLDEQFDRIDELEIQIEQLRQQIQDVLKRL